MKEEVKKRKNKSDCTTRSIMKFCFPVPPFPPSLKFPSTETITFNYLGCFFCYLTPYLKTTILYFNILIFHFKILFIDFLPWEMRIQLSNLPIPSLYLFQRLGKFNFSICFIMTLILLTAEMFMALLILGGVNSCFTF